MTWRRRAVAGGYRRFARVVLRGSVDDMRAGVGVVRRDVLRAVLPHCRSDEHLLEVELLVLAEHLGHRRLLEAPVRIEPAPGHPAGVVTALATALGTLALRKRLARLRRARRTDSVRAAGFYERQPGGWDLVIDEVNPRPFGCARWVRDAPVVALIHQVSRPRWLRGLRHVPVLTVSPSTRESLLDHGVKQVVVVPQGMTEPPVLPSVRKETDPTLVFVGRLTPNERPHDVVTAFEIVRGEFPDAQLWFVGDGPLLGALRRIRTDGVTAWGRVDDVTRFRLMAAAHLMVVTSVREGSGLVVDEAAAVGTASVGYDEPGPEALAAAIIRELPAAMATPPARLVGPLPGRSWDEVAAAVLDSALAATRLHDEIETVSGL